MNLAEPIKNKGNLEKFKNYYEDVKPNGRNKLLVTIAYEILIFGNTRLSTFLWIIYANKSENILQKTKDFP